MALALYLNISQFPVVVNTEDYSGLLPTTLTVNAGDAFVGEATDPLVISALALGLVRLVQTDPGNYMAKQIGVKAGTPSSKLAGLLLGALTTTLTYVSGNGQSGTAGNALASAFVVKLTDANGMPVPGVIIKWAVTSGGGSIVGTTSITNSAGLATAVLTLGSVAGTNTATATASGAYVAGSPVTFTATGV